MTDPSNAAEKVFAAWSSIRRGRSIELKSDRELRVFFADIVSRRKKCLSAKRKVANGAHELLAEVRAIIELAETAAMTIEIKPETEQLVREEVSSGHFSSVDDLIVQGVRALRENARNGESVAASLGPPKKNFAQFLLESPLRGSGLRLERQKDYPGPVEL